MISRAKLVPNSSHRTQTRSKLVPFPKFGFHLGASFQIDHICSPWAQILGPSPGPGPKCARAPCPSVNNGSHGPMARILALGSGLGPIWDPILDPIWDPIWDPCGVPYGIHMGSQVESHMGSHLESIWDPIWDPIWTFSPCILLDRWFK